MEARLLVNSKIYSGWESVSITRSITELSGSFQLSFYDKWAELDEAWTILPGDECQILFDSQPVLTGYIDKFQVSAESKKSLSVAGRDKTGDLIDCSVEGDGYQFKNLTLIQYVKKLCSPFGIDVYSNSLTSASRSINELESVQPGETVHEVLKRLARRYSVLFRTDGLGSLVIYEPLSSFHTSILEVGNNVKSVSMGVDYSDRFSKVTYLGQKADIANSGEVSASFSVDDSDVKRYRPKVEVSDSQGDLSFLKKRAKWDVNIRKAKTFSMDLKVMGWGDDKGELWTPGKLVRVNAPILGVDDFFLINSCNYSLSADAGTETSMRLVHKNTYLEEPESVSIKSSNSGSLKDLLGG